MKVVVINNKRYLFNEDSKASEKWLTELLADLPDAIIEFDIVRPEDTQRTTLKHFLK